MVSLAVKALTAALTLKSAQPGTLNLASKESVTKKKGLLLGTLSAKQKNNLRGNYPRNPTTTNSSLQEYLPAEKDKRKLETEKLEEYCKPESNCSGEIKLNEDVARKLRFDEEYSHPIKGEIKRKVTIGNKDTMVTFVIPHFPDAMFTTESKLERSPDWVVPCEIGKHPQTQGTFKLVERKLDEVTCWAYTESELGDTPEFLGYLLQIAPSATPTLFPTSLPTSPVPTSAPTTPQNDREEFSNKQIKIFLLTFLILIPTIAGSFWGWWYCCKPSDTRENQTPPPPATTTTPPPITRNSLTKEEAIKILDQTDGNCAICLDKIIKKSLTELTVPICGHPIHKECASELLANFNTCPSCRGPFNRFNSISLQYKRLEKESGTEISSTIETQDDIKIGGSKKIVKSQSRSEEAPV